MIKSAIATTLKTCKISSSNYLLWVNILWLHIMCYICARLRVYIFTKLHFIWSSSFFWGMSIRMLIMIKQVHPPTLPPQFLFYSHIHNHAWCNLHVIIHPLLSCLFYMICGLKKISTPPAQHGFSSTQQWWETV